MVAKIKYGKETIVNPLVKTLEGYDIECTLELNTANSLEFKLPKANKFCGKIDVMQRHKKIRLTNDSYCFSGRVWSAEEAIDGTFNYYCEGDRADLNDVVLPPYETGVGDVPSDADQYFMWLVSKYNEVSDVKDQFEFGIIEVSQLTTTGNIYRANSSRVSVWQEIKDKLIDKLGGWVRVRYRGETRIIDYLSGGGKSSVQTIEYGKNLVSWNNTTDGESLFTSVIPIGEDDEGNEVNISSIPDGKLSSGLEKKGVRIINTELFNKYGLIDYVYNTESKYASYLMEKGQEKALLLGISDSLKVSAVDLNIETGSQDGIQVGDYIKVVRGSVSKWFLCNKIVFNPFSTEPPTIHFGATDTLSSVQRAEINRLNAQVEQKITLVDDKATNAQTTATQAQSTANTAQQTANTANQNANTAQQTANAAQGDATQALDDAEEAAKVATDYITDSTSGVSFGKSGKYKAVVSDDSFDIVDEDNNEVSSFGANSIKLGAGDSASIDFCNSTGWITKDAYDNLSVHGAKGTDIWSSYYFGTEQGVSGSVGTSINRTSEKALTSLNAKYNTGSSRTSKSAEINLEADSTGSNIDITADVVKVNGIRQYQGSVVKSGNGSNSRIIWTNAEFKSLFGVDISEKVFVSFCNGDGSSNSIHIETATLFNGDDIYCVFNGNCTGAFRLNYLVSIMD